MNPYPHISPLGSPKTGFLDPRNEGLWMSEVATALGIGGYVAGRVPHWAAKVVAAVLGGASFGIKVGVAVKGDAMLKNPNYDSMILDASNQYYWLSQGVAYYP